MPAKILNPAQRARFRVVEGGSSRSSASSDEELIDAVQQGDARIAGELYDRLVGVVDHTLYRVFGRREPDHEDLIQAAFEQIVLTLSRRTFAGACNLKTWASSVASHVGFNALRSRRRERAVFDRRKEAGFGPESPTVDVERQAAARAELERLRSELVGMKSSYAQTVFLHDVLGHELAEIALMEEVSVAAAQSRLVRGRRELYRRLGRKAKRRGR